MIITNIQLALSSVISRPLRSFITVFAIIVGVVAFTLIAAISEGLNSAAAQEIQDQKPGSLMVKSGQNIIRDETGLATSFIPDGRFRTATLTEQDLTSIGNVKGVAATAPLVPISTSASHGKRTIDNTHTLATTPSLTNILNKKLSSGTLFQEASTRKVAVIGNTVVDELFAGTVSLGSSVTVRGEKFTIIGVLDKVSNTPFSTNTPINNSIFIPLDTAKQLYSNTLIHGIHVSLADKSTRTETAQHIRAAILSNHKGERDFSVLTQEEQIQHNEASFANVQRASVIFSYVILFIGGVIITLIMFIAVSERTREIGIRKSIGATNTNIIVQFITESVMLTIFGSVLGIIFALLAGVWATYFADIRPIYTMQALILITVTSIAVGTMAGLIPAIYAARRNPINSLRN